jgi:hypothetical protein
MEGAPLVGGQDMCALELGTVRTYDVGHQEAWAGVTQDVLDDLGVVAHLEQVGGEAVAEGVERHLLLDPGRLGRPMKGAAHDVFSDGPGGILGRGEQPFALRSLDPPVLAEYGEQLLAQRDLATLAALALPHHDDASGGVDVLGSEVSGLTDPEAGAALGGGHGAVLDGGDARDQTVDLAAGEDFRTRRGIFGKATLETASGLWRVTLYRKRTAATYM